MKKYIIDYTTPDGFNNFVTVNAATLEDAIRVFRSAGIDGWTGYSFAEYEIYAVSER